MSLSRREFLQMLAIAGVAGLGARTARAAAPANLYDVPPFGNVSLLHFTDCHAQLMPVYFREPNINIGVAEMRGKAPHVVGEALLKQFKIAPGSIEAYAFTHLNFVDAARQYGKVGGFAHMATLVKKLRASRPNRTLLLDGGDTWQGSATALWTGGQDMVDACKLLGVDMMTAHWEFTYGEKRVLEIVNKSLKGKMEFLAQNVYDTSFGEERVFKPYAIREVNKVKVGVIGQAFPYTPIANNRFAFPNWSFGIREEEVQRMVDECRKKGAQIVVLLSHNGMDVDLKMASRVRGIDAILGGHTHDAMPAPTIVPNAGGKTLVINSGSNTKFLSLLDLDVRGGKVADFRFKMLPVFSNLLPADKPMADYIAKVRAPFKKKLDEPLAVTESLLYRRGNLNGTIDQMIIDGLLEIQDAEIAFSPGFRWGTTLLPGDVITLEHVMDQTAITYGTATLNEISGADIKVILEDIADNLYNPDPYYQQGGDMVRVGGLTYTLDLNAGHGKRISDLEVRGKKLDAEKKYKVAGWASVQPQPEGKKQIWDLMVEYLRTKKTVRVDKPYVPKLKGRDASNNPGLA
jgi:sulfur-oxidizing protein SoxB